MADKIVVSFILKYQLKGICVFRSVTILAFNMKQLYILLVAGILVNNSTMAQPKPANQPKQTVKDTFALRLLTSIDRLLQMATDEKITGKAMVGEFIGVTSGENPEWQSAVQVPGSSKTTCTHYYTFRNEGITDWNWIATIPKSAGGSRTTTPAKERAEKVVQSFNIQNMQYKGRPFTASVYEYDTSIFIKINYYKGLHNTEKDVLDSMDQLYRPLLFKKQTAGECIKRLQSALSTEGISKDVSLTYFKKLVPQIANVSVEAAFETLMGIDSQADYKEIVSGLSYTQKEEIRTIAKKVVSDYVDAQKAQRDKTDVVVAQKKEIEKVQAPTDPCQKEIWELKLKPGNYVSANGAIGLISAFFCNTHTYTIAWYDAKSKRISLAKNVTVAETSSYSLAYNAPFMLCRSCKGEGSHMEYEWYQMNVASSYYARSNKQTKIPCGECGSRGCIVVR